MEPILRNIENIDWITVLIFGSLLLIVIAKNTFYNRFLNFIILPFNNKYIFMYNKKEKLMNWFHIFFTIFQVVNFSLFLYLSWRAFFGTLEDPELNQYMYPILLGSLLLFLILKVLLQLGNGFIFNSNKIISELVFKKVSYLNHSGLVMFLANIVLSYIFKDSKAVVYLTFFLILLINGIGWVVLLRNHQKFIVSNFFYFILYLCALEIAPWVIIGSYLKY
ncbi:DUF4271 domain-containing protein [Maribacter sp. 2308TA10-17]|uniref:DUF4271 domain-containing protein n=1 Tax=Maribacter sp. 2308TA10-17 TaxID=3386276 RepID=UPI0039BD6773